MNKTVPALAASLLAAAALAQDETPVEEAALPVPQQAPAPSATFLPLPFCRMSEGLAEVRSPASEEWQPVEEGRFYPLGSAYRTRQGGRLVLAFGPDSTATISGESSFGTRQQPLGDKTRGIVLAYGTVDLTLPENLREGAFFVAAPGFVVKNPAGESRYAYETVGDGDKATVRCVTGSLGVEGRHFCVPAMRAANEMVVRTSHDHLVTFLYGTSGDYVVRLDQGVCTKEDIGDDGQVTTSVEKRTSEWHLSPKTKVIISRCLPAIGGRMSVHTMAFDAAGERQSECYFCEGRAEVNSGELVSKVRLTGEEVAKRAAEATTETVAAEDAEEAAPSGSGDGGKKAEDDGGNNNGNNNNNNNNENDASDTEAE